MFFVLRFLGKHTCGYSGRYDAKEVIMETYEPPAILASYTIEELVAEATVCMSYGPYPAPD
jgi:hypothetical protein